MKNGYYKYHKDGKVYIFLVYDGVIYFADRKKLIYALDKSPRELEEWIKALPEYKKKGD